MANTSPGPKTAEYEGWLRDLIGCSECGAIEYREEWRSNGWEEFRVTVCEKCGAVDPEK